MSLVWLPFSVSADFSLSLTKTNACHEMKPVISAHTDIINRSSMHGSMSHLQSDAVMQKAVSDKSCPDKPCCDKNADACVSMSSCGHCFTHGVSFILSSSYSVKAYLFTQSSFEQQAQYYSQIISPAIRPPLV